jgi:lysophospholipase L1-like esterase
MTIPFLPLLARDGKRILAAVPKLPDAEGPEGLAKGGGGKPFRLISFGESTIACVGAKTHVEGFNGTLADKLAGHLERDVEWKVYAGSGFTARRLIDEVMPLIEEREADLIVVGTSGNDAFKLTTPWTFRKDLIEMIDLLQRQFPGTPLAFINLPPIKEFPAFTPLVKRTIGGLLAFHGQQMVQVVSVRNNVFFNTGEVSLEGWKLKHSVEGTTDDFFSDGVHPSLLTYQIWAKDFSEFLVEEGVV